MDWNIDKAVGPRHIQGIIFEDERILHGHRTG